MFLFKDWDKCTEKVDQSLYSDTSGGMTGLLGHIENQFFAFGE